MRFSNARYTASATLPDPTATPTDTPPEDTPTPTATLVPPELALPPADENAPALAAASALSLPAVDTDCSDGECVFAVSSGADDAGLKPECFYLLNAREIYFGECFADGRSIVSGFRFPNVTVPQGASIAEAYLMFTVDGTYTSPMTVKFYGQASGNAAPFSLASRPDNRSRTQAAVDWSISSSDVWSLGAIWQTPNLAPIVSEIINRSDWAAGNALAIISTDADDGVANRQHRRVLAFEREQNANRTARLVVRLVAAREPVILIPGLLGSRISVSPTSQDINWSQPDGHGGTFTQTYVAGEEVWINFGKIRDWGHDDYFDVLRLEKDGITQSTDALYGVQLEARSIVTDALGIDIYGNFLTDLRNAGYQPGVDLFTFPYDWRMSISDNAALLDGEVQAALAAANGTPDQSQWTITQVNLIGHSMGASVAREYISDPARAARVRRLIAIGPAYLGAPKLLKTLLFGDPLICFGLCPLNAAEVKDIVQNMTGAFQIGPGRAYSVFYDGSDTNHPVVFQEDRDFDGDGLPLGALTYDQLKDLLFRLDRDAFLDWDGTGKDVNQTLFNVAEAFHDRLDFSWDAGVPVPEVDLIVGTGRCSLGQIQSMNQARVWGRGWGVVPIIRANYINGDDTVPLFSASLYDPASGIDHRGGANVYYVEKKHSEHTFLASKAPVRQLVLNLLTESGELPEGITTQNSAASPSCSGTLITAESPVELHVSDAAGNHTGLATLPDIGGPVIEQGIPDSWYDEIEESKSIYLPDDGVYTITLRASDGGDFNLLIRAYRDEGLAQTLVWLRAPLTPTTIGEVVYDTSVADVPVLQLDHDGDGVFDETIAATSVLGPGEGADVQAPVVEIQSPADGSTVEGKVHLIWTVTDDLSGVLTEIAEVDSGTASAQPAANGSAVFLLPGSHSLTAIAEDRLGNAALRESTFTVVGPCSLPDLTALLDDLQASGLITQRGVYESLREKLEKAQKEQDKGKPDKAAEKIWDFVEQLGREVGKGRVDAVGAALLHDGAFCILGTLGKDETGLREIEGLRDLVAMDYQQGLITSASLRDKLDERLAKAQEKLVDEDAEDAAEEVQKFIAEVNKERGKKIDATAADELVTRAQAILARLDAGGDDDD